MQTRAAVAHEAGKPLTIETVTLDGPRAGEVLMATTLEEDAARRSSRRQRALYRLWFALDDAEVTQG